MISETQILKKRSSNTSSLLETPNASTPAFDFSEDELRLMVDNMSNILTHDDDNVAPPTPNMKDHRPDKITDHIYIGNEINARDADLLRSLGITHILNCKSGTPMELDGVKVCQVPLDDRGNSDLANIKFPAAFKFLDEALLDSSSKVLIHCQLGQNRSVTIAIGYLVHHYDMTLKDAYQTVMDARAIACINDQYAKKLIEWEVSLRRSSSIEIGQIVTTKTILADLQKHPSLLLLDAGSTSQRESLSLNDNPSSRLFSNPSMRIFNDLFKNTSTTNLKAEDGSDAFGDADTSFPLPTDKQETSYILHDPMTNQEEIQTKRAHDKRLPDVDPSEAYEQKRDASDRETGSCCTVS